MSLIKIVFYLFMAYPIEWFVYYITNDPPTFSGALLWFMTMTFLHLVLGGSYATYKSLVSLSIRAESFYGWLLWPAVYVWKGHTISGEYDGDKEPEVIPYYGINLAFLKWSINLTWS